MATASMDLGPVFQAAGREWNIDPALLQAVAGQESGGLAYPDHAVSSAGAQGRMQLMPATARQMGVEDTSDPVQNIFGGAKYLSQQLDKYGTPELALAAYNGGPGRLDAYLAGQGSLPAETVAYVPGVTRRYQTFASQQPSAPTDPSVDATATANLDTRMAQLRAGGGQPDPSSPSSVAGSATGQFPNAGGSGQLSSTAGNANQFATMSPADFFAATAGTGPGQAPSGSVATSSSAAPTGTPPTSSQGAGNAFASMSPADFFAATAGTPPVAGNGGAASPLAPGVPAAPALSAPQAQTGYHIPYTSIELPSATNLAEGAGHAVLDASHALYSAIDAGNRAVPVPGQSLGGLINPKAALANLDAENAAYQASGTGNTIAGQAGDLAGQTILTVPALGGLGGVAAGVGRGIATAADAVSPALGIGARAVGSFLSGTASADNKLVNMALRPASLAANGAAQGATVNLLTGDPSNVGVNMLTGAGYGAALGPVAPLAGKAVNAARATIAPFTRAGQGAIADAALARMAMGNPLTSNATVYVPGSSPTLAEATGNAGLAGAQRAVASLRPNQFTAQATANNEARAAYVNNLTGTPTDIEAAEISRGNTAVPAITAPLANATSPADAQPVVNTIDQILASPAGQRDAVTSALGNIRSKLVTPIPFGDRVDTALNAVNGAITSGNADPGLWAAREALVGARNGGAQQASTVARLQATTSTDPPTQAIIDQATQTIGTANRLQTDPGQLYGIRKAIGDALSPLSANAGSDAQLASSELQQVKDALDNSIEGAAPGFKQGIADYADASKPIDAMRYLQSKGYTSADGTVTLAKVKSVLDDIQKQQALPGPRTAKNVPDATVTSLQGLYADLLRQNNSRLGMQPGSNTFQQLGVNNTLAAYGAPLSAAAKFASTIPVVGNMLTGTIGRAYQSTNEPILDAVVNRLMYPETGASVLQKARLLQLRQAAGPAGPNALTVDAGVNALSGRRQ